MEVQNSRKIQVRSGLFQPDNVLKVGSEDKQASIAKDFAADFHRFSHEIKDNFIGRFPGCCDQQDG